MSLSCNSMEQKEFTNMAETLRCRILAVARGFRLCSDDAEDVAQDTMLKLWTIRGEVDDAKRAVGLAVTIARNLTIDKLRRKSKDALDEISIADSPYAQPDYILEENENSVWLKERLGRLPSKEYSVLRLRQVERKTTEEIAAIVGIQPVSVPTLLARARKKLLDDIKKLAL